MNAKDIWNQFIFGGGGGGGGGAEPTGTKEISITENGTTTENVKNYASASITVDVPPTQMVISETQNHMTREEQFAWLVGEEPIIAEFQDVQVVDRNSFRECGCFQAVIFSDPGMQYIADGAFYFFAGDVVITCDSYVVQLHSGNAFEGLQGAIYVPDALVDSYKAATNWAFFASIIRPVSESPYING